MLLLIRGENFLCFHISLICLMIILVNAYQLMKPEVDFIVVYSHPIRSHVSNELVVQIPRNNEVTKLLFCDQLSNMYAKARKEFLQLTNGAGAKYIFLCEKSIWILWS